MPARAAADGRARSRGARLARPGTEAHPRSSRASVSNVASADAIAAAPNQTAKNGKIGAFDNKTDAHVGKTLTQTQADILEQLAAAL